MISNEVLRTKPTETSKYIRSFTENYDRNVLGNRNSLHQISTFALRNSLSPTQNIGSDLRKVCPNLSNPSGQIVVQSNKQIFVPNSTKNIRPVPGLLPVTAVSSTAPDKQKAVFTLFNVANNNDGSMMKNGIYAIIFFIVDFIS